MATDPNCCGCSLVDDYGTSFVTGDGNTTTPYQVDIIDPDFIRPAVKVHKTGNISLVANVPQILSFTNEQVDTAGMWDIGNPTRITIPVGGVYLFGCAGKFFSDGGAGTREMRFLHNGLQVANGEVSHEIGFTPEWTLLYPIVCFAGDYVEMQVRADDNVTFFGYVFPNGPISSVMWAIYLGKVV